MRYVVYVPLFQSIVPNTYYFRNWNLKKKNDIYVPFHRLRESWNILFIYICTVVLIAAQDPNAFAMFFSKTTLSPVLLQKIEDCHQICGDSYYNCAVTHCQNENCENSCRMKFQSCFTDCDQQRPTTSRPLRVMPDVNSFVIRHQN